MVDSDEPVLERAIGTKIDWKAGKNVTVKVCLYLIDAHHTRHTPLLMAATGIADRTGQ